MLKVPIYGAQNGNVWRSNDPPFVPIEHWPGQRYMPHSRHQITCLKKFCCRCRAVAGDSTIRCVGMPIVQRYCARTQQLC